MQTTANIPVDIISIIQAMIIAFIAAPAIIRWIYHLREPRTLSVKSSLAGGEAKCSHSSPKACAAGC